MTRVASNIEHRRQQEVLLDKEVAEGHLLRWEELRQTTRAACNIEHSHKQEVLVRKELAEGYES